MSNSKRHVYDWLPIKDWTEEQVFEYLSTKEIPLHPVYNYLRRFSCRVCIYMNKHDVRQVNANDPEAIDIIENLEKVTGFTMFQGSGIREFLK